MKRSLLPLTSLLISIAFSTPAYALSTPSFPVCANPQGQIKVSYSEGTHGIVGSSATYTGRDVVYTLSQDTLMQCFCAEDGSGIQTNWWKASSLSDNDINVLKAQGWYYVPTGSVWGLSNDPYLAQNISYSCLPGETGSQEGTGGGSSAILGDGIGGGEVLGLAATGDSGLVYASFLLGLILTVVGIKRFRHNP